MKKSILIIAAVLMTSVIFAANMKYYQKMGQTLPKFGECKTIEDYHNLGNEFKVIANVEKEEWLPLYYHAQCNIIMSFMNCDAAQKDEFLEIANESITKMIAIAPKESEVYALQAFYCTGKLVVNPQERAQKYGPLSAQAIGMSLGLDPENPRAQYIKISNEKGTAQFFGQDTQIYCTQAQELLDKWDDYKVKSRIHPSWGKQQVEGIVNSCGQTN
ncbi:MAG: hypothetical protein JEZ09_06635 [Salinivirgaceae bacterium]|nr:hypothetical protein [Salinivirgaceae bacterium]